MEVRDRLLQEMRNNKAGREDGVERLSPRCLLPTGWRVRAEDDAAVVFCKLTLIH